MSKNKNVVKAELVYSEEHRLYGIMVALNPGSNGFNFVPLLNQFIPQDIDLYVGKVFNFKLREKPIRRMGPGIISLTYAIPVKVFGDIILKAEKKLTLKHCRIVVIQNMLLEAIHWQILRYRESINKNEVPESLKLSYVSCLKMLKLKYKQVQLGYSLLIGDTTVDAVSKPYIICNLKTDPRGTVLSWVSEENYKCR